MKTKVFIYHKQKEINMNATKIKHTLEARYRFYNQWNILEDLTKAHDYSIEGNLLSVLWCPEGPYVKYKASYEELNDISSKDGIYPECLDLCTMGASKKNDVISKPIDLEFI